MSPAFHELPVLHEVDDDDVDTLVQPISRDLLEGADDAAEPANDRVTYVP